MNLWKSLAGELEVEITSAAPKEILKAAADQGIALSSVQPCEGLYCTFRIDRRSYQDVDAICRKRGDTIRILGRQGIFWTAAGLCRRRVLLAGLLLIFALTLFLPTRVFFIEVEGNSAVPEREIVEAAEELGLYFGANRREIRSERLKNGLLSKIPELRWAGVNTRGCVAVISVRERSLKEENDTQKSGVGNVVASRDGVVTEITVTRGRAVCQAGQAVKKGQTLISGYTDCGLSIRAEQAQGEVYGQTTREITTVAPLNWTFRGGSTGQRRSVRLILGKKQINLWKGSGIRDTSCGRIRREYPITLPGGFRLPVTLVIETVEICEMHPRMLNSEDVLPEAEQFSGEYLTSHMVAGKILAYQRESTEYAEIVRFMGKYECLELIGREQME